MHRIVIVDDEPYVADSMEEMLVGEFGDRLDVGKAYSAEEALALLDRMKVDIVLTDVRMPGLSGLELHREIRMRWPSCKIIFLTGYDDFGYIQDSMRRGGVVDFILKMEEDDKVAAAVEKAIEELERESNYASALNEARHRLKEAMPLLQHEYWLYLLRQPPDSLAVVGRQFAELNIGFEAEASVVVIVGKIDRWLPDLSGSDRSLLLYAVANIARECFGPDVRFAQVNANPGGFVWFVQPIAGDSDAWRTFRSFAWGTLEAIQTSCSHYLKLSLSVVLGAEPCSWTAAGEVADTLKFILGSETGGDAQMVRIDEKTLGASKTEEHSYSDSDPDAAYALKFREQRLRFKLKGLELLEAHLERGESDAFEERLRGLADAMEAASYSLRLEFFCTLSALFLSLLNRRSASQRFLVGISLDKLTDLKQHNSWKEMTNYFVEVARQLFRSQEGERSSSNDRLINRLHDYIGRHLDRELSLTSLAELVHLHPFYLSRQYVRVTGASLSEYIAAARMDKAEELLSRTDLKIHEIASAVGYAFTPSFSRNFKKLRGMTPQEYRDLSNPLHDE